MQYKSILSVFILFLNISLLSADNTESTKKAEELLNHSNTYYWLSRARGNTLRDIHKNIYYADKAKKLLLQLPTSKKVSELTEKANVSIKEAQAQLDSTEDTIWGFSSLMPLLLANDDYNVYFDDIDEVAVERSIKTLCEQLPIIKEQLYLIILSKDKNEMSEEVAHTYINENTSYYALTKHEILSVLTPEELDLLYTTPIPATLLNKLSSAFSPEGIGIITIMTNDEVDNIYYAGSTFQYWDTPKKKFLHYYYADGFAEQPPPQLWTYLLVLLGFCVAYLFNSVNKNKSKGSFPPLWYGGAIAAFTLLIDHMLFTGLKSSGLLDPMLITISPYGALSLAAINTALFLLPPIVVYISSIKLPQVAKILNNAETISTIAAASTLGSIVYLTSLAVLKYDTQMVIINFAISFSAILLPSFFIGRSFSKHLLQEDATSGVLAWSTSVILFISLSAFLKYNTMLILSVAIAINLFSCFLYFVIPYIVLSIKKHKQANNEESEKLLQGLDWLRNKLDNPPYYHCNKEVFDNAVKWITEDDDEKIDMVFIEADQGCGKTRMAYEIADSIALIEDNRKSASLNRDLQEDEKTIILFGDCDDPSTGSVLTPYEPFAQALSDFLGLGQFSNPAEKAEKLKSGLAGVALDTAMNAAGVGAFSSLLGAGEEGETCKTNSQEMTKVIAETLSNISLTRKIIFILDDTQWMDDETFELFELLLNELNSNFNDNQINFILTSRKVDDDDKIKDLIDRLDNTGDETKTDIIDVFTVTENDLQNPDIVGGVLENLKFDYNAQEQLIGYFDGENRPLPVLMTLKLLLDKNYIVEIGERYELAPGINLKELPPPDYYNEILNEITADMSQREKNLLQCCAVIGRRFNVSVVAEIFGISVLECLELLEKAEEKNIITDVLEEDDIFEFVEKRIANLFRVMNVKDNEKLIQHVREYHKKFVSIKERCEFSELTYHDIISTAQHAETVKDVYPELAVKYNRAAAVKTYHRGLFKSAGKYFKNALTIIDTRTTIIPKEEIAAFYLAYMKCLLDQEADISLIEENIDKMSQNLKISSQKDFSEKSKEYYEIELLLIKALQLFKARKFQDTVDLVDSLLKNASITPSQIIRSKFYRAISWNRQELDKCKELHLEVFNEIDNLLNKKNLPQDEVIEILKVKSELSNNYAFVIMRNEPDLAILYFKKAIEINEMPEINDQKGIAIANGGIGDCMSAKGEIEKAREAYLINYNISKNNGDMQGIGRMSSMLGGLLVREVKTLELSSEEKSEKLNEAAKLYRESLSVALSQNNTISIAFAFAGMINTEAEEESPDLGYELKKFSEVSLEEIPDFAKDALNAAIDAFIAKHPDSENDVKKMRLG